MNARASIESTKSVSVQLLYAIQQNDLHTVQELLSNVTLQYLNKPWGPLQISALQMACSLPGEEALPMVQLLMASGASSSIPDKLGRTPLHGAATNGNHDVCALLVENGAEINAKYEINSNRSFESQLSCGEQEHVGTLPLPECWGRTPLHQAVKSNNSSIVKLLIDNGALINATDEHGVTPLLLAGAGVQKDTLSEYEDIVELLVENEADVNVSNHDSGTTALHHAVALGSMKATTTLLNAHARIKEARCGQTPLHEAAEKGNADILLLLLNSEIRQINKSDNSGRTVLHKAAFAGSRDCVKLLCDYGGDLSKETNSKITVFDAIFKYVPRPLDLMKNILNSKITCNNANMNSLDFKLDLDFRVLAPEGSNKQMSVISTLLDISSNTQMNEIMQHPLIETYLRLKWERLRIFFTILVLIYVLFVISLSTYIILVVRQTDYEFLIYLSRTLLLMSATSLFGHAVLQCLLVPRHYFLQYEMWLNLVCALLSFIIGLVGADTIKPGNGVDGSASWILHIMSITVLLAWAELMLLIGRFPTYGYYALMFSTVLQNVVKVLLTFVCLVIGFALSFSVQFHDSKQFRDPWRALVKTTVMMMGEFDYGDLFPEAENSTDSTSEPTTLRLPGTSRFIFLMFIILASIVLMNLMVGLAVNDIQALQTAGYVQRLIKQAIFLFHLETVLSHSLLKSPCVPSGLYSILYSRRCIPTEFTLRPGHVEDKITNWKKLLPFPLMECIVKIAVDNKKIAQSQDETDGTVLTMFRCLQEQIFEMRNVILDLSNKLNHPTQSIL